MIKILTMMLACLMPLAAYTAAAWTWAIASYRKNTL